MQRCQLPDCFGFLVYGRLLCYGVRISLSKRARERKRADNFAATHGASKPISTDDDDDGAEGSAEGRWRFFILFVLHVYK